MLLVQGFIYIGMTGVVFINLKEGIQDLKRQREQVLIPASHSWPRVPVRRSIALRPTTKSKTIRPEPVPAREPCVCLRVFACMQEEGLGVVARVEQVSIYIVFFAINLISGARPKTGGGERENGGKGSKWLACSIRQKTSSRHSVRLLPPFSATRIPTCSHVFSPFSHFPPSPLSLSIRPPFPPQL